ncbi:hypothetical protein DL990_20065 [Amycolatopsis sp. WAC 01416]|uniref:hypothetical protein n=1 Tax=Amycolatopsis sp. WAC 01416 TaxID=2203196 RepID=UPI000F7A888C|nr:hypothetical protein [Amycolatopsis sp. WAC 01416]RSN32217.1 hypothetical protein DL990_20065 [Amycolatopsis sp. WAC 01416]
MRTARPTRRQIEAAAEDLDFDALSVSPAGVADLLADPGYEVSGLPEFDFETRTLAEFEAAITPVDETASVVELSSWPVGGVSGAGKTSTRLLAQLHGFGEVA